jgi:hypothetical protein
MSVVRSLLLGLGGAAIVATGVAGTASTANAQVVAATPGACEIYAHEYAAVHASQFGTAGWDTAYRFAYNECLIGGPSFVAGLGYVAGSALHAGAHVAGTALHAGTSLAGAALSIPGTILGGTAAALAPPATTAPAAPVVSPTAEPVVTKNYRGTFEAPRP